MKPLNRLITLTDVKKITTTPLYTLHTNILIIYTLNDIIYKSF